jgi:beta-N-acetylhexosaminidase
VIFCLANYNSLAVLQELKQLGARVIVVSALSPVYLSEAAWVRTAIAVYGDGRESFRAGFGVLAGDYPATGILPVDFSRKGTR